MLFLGIAILYHRAAFCDDLFGSFRLSKSLIQRDALNTIFVAQESLYRDAQFSFTYSPIDFPSTISQMTNACRIFNGKRTTK
jgi:hypothetical protein